jgi:hypothetical protein
LYSPLVGFWCQVVNCGCDIRNLNATECDSTDPHHLVQLVHTGSTAKNYTGAQPLPLVGNIAAITDLETEEDDIIIAQNDKIAHLHDMSLEGDIPDNISNIVEVIEKALFRGGYILQLNG